MAQTQIDLAKLFQAVLQGVQQNQTALNQADTYNHNHGDNMVQIFQQVNQALAKKKNASTAQQLSYASRMLQRNAQSGTGKVYAQGFAKAAGDFKGTEITLDKILPLLQVILGGGQTTRNDNLLNSLLGALGGSQGTSSVSGNQLVQLLGSLLGSSSGQGSDALGSLVSTLLGGSPMAQSSHRTQSSQIVTQALLQVLSQLGK